MATFSVPCTIKATVSFCQEEKKNCTTGWYSFFLEGTGEIKLILIREAEL